MAIKVLLITGFDKTESEVAEAIARQLKSLLEGREFEIRVEKILPEESWITIAEEALKAGRPLSEEVIYALKERQIRSISRRFADYHVFDIHCGPHGVAY